MPRARVCVHPAYNIFLYPSCQDSKRLASDNHLQAPKTKAKYERGGISIYKRQKYDEESHAAAAVENSLKTPNAGRIFQHPDEHEFYDKTAGTLILH